MDGFNSTNPSILACQLSLQCAHTNVPFVLIQGKTRQNQSWLTAESSDERAKGGWSQIVYESLHGKLKQRLRPFDIGLDWYFFNIFIILHSFQGSLDAEWLEINNVFLEVMRAVEDTRQKALQPLEERLVLCRAVMVITLPW